MSPRRKGRKGNPRPRRRQKQRLAICPKRNIEKNKKQKKINRNNQRKKPKLKRQIKKTKEKEGFSQRVALGCSTS